MGDDIHNNKINGCHFHNHKLKFYCSDCSVPVCSNCYLYNQPHCGHKVNKSSDDHNKKMSNEFYNLHPSIPYNINDKEYQINDCSKKKEKLKDNKEYNIKILSDKYEEFRQWLIESEGNAIKEIIIKHNSNELLINKYIADLIDDNEKLQSVLNYSINNDSKEIAKYYQKLKLVLDEKEKNKNKFQINQINLEKIIFDQDKINSLKDAFDEIFSHSIENIDDTVNKPVKSTIELGSNLSEELNKVESQLSNKK